MAKLKDRRSRKHTLNEKIALLSGKSQWQTQDIPEAGVPSVRMSDGPNGLRIEHDDDETARYPATCFPCAVTLACSWDESLAYEMGCAIGRAALACGVDVVLAPGVNIKRSPLCGRNFEYYSEDPLLSGRMGTAFVNGVQSTGAGATVKHFVANNQETNRMTVDARISNRALFEIYLRPFEMVIEAANPAAVMVCYNQVNGKYVSENQTLLTTVLRHAWGYDGLVMSDWYGVMDRVKSLKAGLDLEMPSSGGINGEKILSVVHRGQLRTKMIDRSAQRVVTFAKQYAHEKTPRTATHVVSDAMAKRHHRLACKIASESFVLLENNTIDDVPVLPLKIADMKTLLVVGDFAKHPRYQGAGSSQVNALHITTPLDAIKKTFRRTTVLEAAVEDDEKLEQQATQADAVLCFVGLPENIESEGADRKDMNLPADQRALMQKMIKANPKTVVIVQNGGAVLLGDASGAGALLETWLGGEALGEALTDVLTGRVNPSGRLAETIPLKESDTPTYLNFPGDGKTVTYGEDIFVGYRYYDKREMAVAYPFGYGLSYSTFDYDNLTVRESKRRDTLVISCDVTNTSAVSGYEVVQVYGEALELELRHAVRELIDFKKIYLKAGQAKRVRFEVARDNLRYYDETLGRFERLTGDYRVCVGHDSRNLPLLETVFLDGKPTLPPITLMSTVEDILKRPRGQELFDMAFDFYENYTGTRPDMDDIFTASSVMGTPLLKLPAVSQGMVSPKMLRRVMRYINGKTRTFSVKKMILEEVDILGIIRELTIAALPISIQRSRTITRYSIDTPLDLLFENPACKAVLAEYVGEDIINHPYAEKLAKTGLTLRQIQRVTPFHLFKKPMLTEIDEKLEAIPCDF